MQAKKLAVKMAKRRASEMWHATYDANWAIMEKRWHDVVAIGQKVIGDAWIAGLGDLDISDKSRKILEKLNQMQSDSSFALRQIKGRRCNDQRR